MRDILTVLASLVILVLAAAIVAPPLIDWEARRDLVDQAISRATGTEARTGGRIGIRLLPTPRLRVDQLRLGSPRPDSPSLTADFLWAEIELTPLLRGEVRFLETRVGRADLRIPLSPDGSWRLPPDVANGAQGRDFAIDRLFVAQLLVTTQVTSTGRTDQAYAEQVTIEGQQLAGPWRLEGTTSGVPFRLVTGQLGPDRTVVVKLSGGGDVTPRFDIDAKVSLDQGAGGSTIPNVAGKAKLLLGPPAQVATAGIPIPVTVDTGFKTSAGGVDLETVTVEAGEGGASLRLTGTGRIAADDPRISLKLEGKRLDADGFLLSGTGQDFLSRLPHFAPPPASVPIDLDLSLTSVLLAQEELSNLVLRGAVERGRVRVERLDFTAPGETRVAIAGEAGLTLQGGLSGRVALASQASDRFARYIDRFGLNGPFFRLLDGRPVDAAAEVSLAGPDVTFRNARLKAGDATITGNARYAAPQGTGRGRLDAQLAVQGLDIDQLPQVSSIFDATQNLDVGFTVDARNVRAGTRGGAGRITARILSDGPALRVESLDIVDLAGANAKVSGRILPDGSGRIAGKVTAARAAPLVDLLGSVWIGGVSKLVPHFLREGDLDLDIVTERAVPERGPSQLRLRTTARGRAAGGSFDSEVLTHDGITQSLDVRLATENTGRWVGRGDVPILRRPSSATLRGVRVGSGLFNVTLAGDLGGVKVATTRPFALSAGDDVVDSGEAELSTPDITPFLVLLGDGAATQPPVPVEARITLGRERDASLLMVSGKVTGDPIQVRLAVRSRADVSGTVTLERLSLPWLASTLALNPVPQARSGTPWSSARFGESGRLLSGGQAAFRVARLDLGRGVVADRAGFTAVVTPDGLTLRDADAGLNGGRIKGSLAITRQGSVASVVTEGSLAEVPLAALSGPSTLSARLSGSFKLGATGETVAGLVANLGGAGEARLSKLQAPSADPRALTRAVQAILASDDPLGPGRAQALLADEFARAPLETPSVTTQISMVGGTLRLSPFVADSAEGAWSGAVSYDFKTLALDARGTLTAKANPRGWTGAPPSVGITWRGALDRPVREIDSGMLANALAAIVLQRELERIEAFELDSNERLRRTQRRDYERQRERDRQAAEEAARQAQIRAEQERQRLEAEQRARAAERLNAPEAVQPSPSALPDLPVIDLRPPPPIQIRPGG